MGLLRELSDEELDQYARLAADQVRRENRFAWAQVALALFSALTLVWTFFSAIGGGLDRARVAAVGLAGLMLYWPYRKAKSRRVWQRHIAATREEQARRAEAASAARRDGNP